MLGIWSSCLHWTSSLPSELSPSPISFISEDRTFDQLSQLVKNNCKACVAKLRQKLKTVAQRDRQTHGGEPWIGYNERTTEWNVNRGRVSQ